MFNLMMRLIPKEKKETLRREVLSYLETLKEQPFEDVQAVRRVMIHKIQDYEEIPSIGKQFLAGRINSIQARTPAEYLEKLTNEVKGF